MRTSLPGYVAIGVVAVGLAVVSLALEPGSTTPLDVAFAAFLYALLLLALRAGAVALLDARLAARLASSTSRRTVDDVARSAIREERARMSADVAAVVRRALVEIDAQVARLRQSRDDEVPALLRDVQRLGRGAVAELRRMVGLLRAEALEAEPATVAAVAGPRPHRADVLLAAATVLLCAVEAVLATVTGELVEVFDVAVGPVSVVLSLVAAATVLVWRTNPSLGATVVAVLAALGIVLEAPLLTGGWMVSLGLTLWGCVARGRRGPLVVVGPVAMIVGTLASQWIWFRANTLILAVVYAAALATGVLVRAGETRRERAAARAAERRAELVEGAREVVRADRHALAADLHDTVSGTVGVIVMQAGAAEVHWEGRRELARRSIAVIVTSVDDALRELDELVSRLGGDTGAAHRGLEDLDALVDRMRASGLSVRPEVGVDPDGLDPEVATCLYRVAQEGLANVARHAPGAAVDLRIRRVGPDVELSLADDGATTVGDGPGFGLVGLAERVERLEGRLVAGARPSGAGWLLTARLPSRASVPKRTEASP